MARRRRRGRTAAQTAGVIVASGAAIIGLVVTALFISGTVTLEMLGFGGDGAGGYRNITLVDAQLVCEAEARKEFAERLKSITVDSHSSRFDEKSNRYKMYFDVDMYPKRGNKNIAVNHFLNCFVHGSRGSVTHFESVEDREEGPKPIRETEGRIFGF